jgi:hypothetical protein
MRNVCAGKDYKYNHFSGFKGLPCYSVLDFDQLVRKPRLPERREKKSINNLLQASSTENVYIRMFVHIEWFVIKITSDFY